MTQRLLLAGICACLVLAGGSAQAATATYGYDALGRLTSVTYSNGKVATYGYDPAGNRTQVVSGTQAGVPSSITVPSSSSTGSYSVSWGSATGTVTAYELYEATNSGFSGQTRVYNGSALSAAISGKGNGTYYYRVRSCLDTSCNSTYQTGANAVTVTIAGPPAIQVLNPAISVGATQTTQITTLANLNGHAATIHNFTETCSKASVVIPGGSQSVTWTNTNTFIRTCEPGNNQTCTASYVIRNTSSGQTYPGTAAITVLAQGQNLGAGQSCP